MITSSRRVFLAGAVAVTAGTAGCLGGGGDDGGSDPPELGEIADSATPSDGQPLPSPVAGDPDADVTVAVFEDYACPHCATYSLEVFPQLAAEYLETEQVRYEFHDFPIPVDERLSWQAASAARAVQADAGSQAFFVYSERLFANQDSIGPAVYGDHTEGIDADGETVRRAGTERRYDQTVEADKEAGRERGVQGTPTVFVDGERVQWQEIAYEPVRDAIESARGR
jgi:protein-disulfide isomerase